VAVEAVRVRSLDDVVVAFFEPERDFEAADMQRWYDALELPSVAKTLTLSVGPVRSTPEIRREGVARLERRGIRVVMVSNNRLNRGLAGMFGWLGVPISAYSWAQLEDAARDVASRPELIAPIVRAARALRAESPAAVGLAPDEG
jgi:hypothetical protein